MDKIAFTQRLTGKYSYGIWLQPLFWVLLSQLLWYKKIAKKYNVDNYVFLLINYDNRLMKIHVNTFLDGDKITKNLSYNNPTTAQELKLALKAVNKKRQKN